MNAQYNGSIMAKNTPNKSIQEFKNHSNKHGWCFKILLF
jgi:hypothetical protein